MRNDKITLSFRPDGGQADFTHEPDPEPVHRLEAADGKAVLLVGGEGIALARLAPYPGWTRLRDEAWRAWEEFSGHVPEPGAARIGIRYVNRFPVPSAPFDLGDYFTLGPKNPSIQNIENFAAFHLAMAFPQPDLEAIMVFNQRGLETDDGGNRSIVLDYDLATVPRIEPVPYNRIWPVLDSFHERQGKLFRATLTEKALRELS